MTEAILYSFRRCPYAIRARMALAYAGIQCEIREVRLKDKPADMLSHSPKGTVPVLITPTGDVIDESLDIMLWSLQKNDPQHWLKSVSLSKALIASHDQKFKPLLDHYKYADRYPQLSANQHRELTLPFIESLETRLQQHRYLISDHISVADVAVFPFIRQYAFVDKEWFNQLPYIKLNNWLSEWLKHPLFEQAMFKFKPFNDGYRYHYPSNQAC